MKQILKTLFFLPLFLYGHPHTFIDLYPIVISKNDMVESIKFRWEMDDISSEMLKMEFDQNMDGIIDEEENKYVAEFFFEPLKVYGFYTDIMIKNKSVKTIPKDFRASIVNNKIVYSFTVDIDANKNDFYIDFYDSDNFVAIVLKKEFVISFIDYSVKGVDNDYYFAHRIDFKKDS